MRRLPIRGRLAALLLIALSASAAIIDRIAVSVGNRVITTSDLDREVRVTAFLNGSKPDFSASAKRATAARLVEQKLIRNELETSRYPLPSPSEVEPELQQFKQKFYPEDGAYQRALAEYGITDDDVRAELLWQRSLLLFIDIRFRPGVQITDQEIQDYFEKTVAPAARLAHPGQPVTLDQYRDEIQQKLTGERVDQDLDRWLEQVRRRTQIVYHAEVF
jgi:peptidyl-prolyl cis-trans isomerase SurA